MPDPSFSGKMLFGKDGTLDPERLRSRVRLTGTGVLKMQSA